jgi:nucleoside-diphosphate-sugar epimerase
MKDKSEVIIVTGSSGMIGSALIHKLAAKYHVVGFDHDGYPLFPAEAKWDYPKSKVTTEKVMHEQRSNIPTSDDAYSGGL